MSSTETPSGTFSNRVSELVLSSCRAKDGGARISSVLRDSAGRTVVRVRSSEESRNPLKLLSALKELWPLAKTAVIENALDGSVEAEIVVPREDDERASARRRARSTRAAAFLWVVARALLLVGVALYVTELLHMQGWTATPEPNATTDREL
tara:strand:+ start:1809 stop:2264 length:456 start_codon:yes stop_codon:yes gene_type:complete